MSPSSFIHYVTDGPIQKLETLFRTSVPLVIFGHAWMEDKGLRATRFTRWAHTDQDH